MNDPLRALSKKEQDAIIAQAQKELTDNADKAGRLVTAGFDPTGNGDFIIVGSTSELAISNIAIRLTHLQQLALMSQILQTLTAIELQAAAAHQRMMQSGGKS